MPSKWNRINESTLQRTRVFDLCIQRMRFPDGYTEDDFYTLRCPDWTNILPITKDGDIVLIRQFRQGTQEYCLETPGGLVDEGEHDFAKAAERELTEETGFVAERLLPLGDLDANPALLNNRCHFFLALEVEKKHELCLDPSEDLSVELIPLHDLAAMMMAGNLRHSLVYATVLLALLRYPRELGAFWPSR